MRIATWNVNSVKQRVPRLLPWLDQRRPDGVCLQETKLADGAFAELLHDELTGRGYEIAVHGEPAWNGVAILSRVGLAEVTAGIEHLWRTLPLRQMTVGATVALLVIGFAETLIFSVIAHLGKPPSFFGVFATLQGIG